MKKIYITPANRVYNVQTTSMMAESGTTQTVSGGGTNKNGGPTAAETREEASWSSSDAWDNEW